MVERQILLVEKNFTKDNFAFYTLTFRRKEKDPSIEEAIKHFQNFSKRLKRHLPGVRCCAVLHLGSLRSRPHFHIIITCTDRTKIASLWQHGTVFKRKIKTKTLIDIVMYMYYGAYKRRNKSLFINSRNLVKPYKYIREIKIPFEKLLDIINEAYVDERTIHYRIEGENPFIGKHFKLFVEADQYERICRLIKEIE